MNKFKEKKMIITGTIVAMGFLIVAITVPVVLVISNKNKSEDEKNANRKILDKEKARIDSLERFTIKKSVVEISLNSLHSSELELGEVVPGIKYVPTHKQFTKDGNYIVSIKLSISSQSVIATRKIKIEGIDAFKTKMANQQAVNNVAKLFDKLKNAKDGTSSKLATKQTTLPSSLKYKTTASAIGFLDPSADKRNGVNVDFEIASHDDNNGTLVVKATISKGTIKKIVTFKLKDMQTKVQHILEQEKSRIEGLPIMIIKKSVLSIHLNTLKKSDLDLGNVNSDIKYEPTHEQFTKDGNYIVSIKLSISSQSVIAKRKIKIEGIDAFKTKKDNEQAVNNVAQLFNDLKNAQGGTNSTLLNKSRILPSSLEGKKTASAIGFLDPSANQREGTNVAFEIASHDDNHGTLVVKANISKGTIKKIVTFKLKDMQTQVQYTLEQEKSRIEVLPIMIIKKSVLSIHLNTLQISDLNLGNINSDIKYEPTHKEFTADGEYNVPIKLSLHNQTATATRKIQIQGINAFKTKMANQKAVDDVAELFDKLIKAQGGTISTLVTKSTTLPSSLNGETTASAIGFEDPSADKRNGTNVVFEIASHDDNHGTLVVKATISKGTIKKIVTFKLKDMQTKKQATIKEKQKILEQEKSRIEVLPIMIIKKSVLSIHLNTLQISDLNLGNINSDIKYEPTHKEFTADGEYNVPIKLSMHNQTATATRKIQIQGINAFKTKMDNQKAVDDVAELFDKLIKAQGGTISTLVTKSTTLPSSLNGETTASAIGFEDPSADKRNGTNVVFEIASHDDNHGTLIVRTTISKGQASKVVSFKLKDMQTIDQKILSQEKMRIEGLGIITINKPVSNLPSNSLQKSDLDLGNLNSDIKYQYTHEEFTADGEYNVSITLSIGKQKEIAVRRIKIQGIDDAKDKETIDNEKLRIEALNFKKITKLVISGNSIILTKDEMQIGVTKPKIKYVWQDPIAFIKKDGNYYINIKIEKNSYSVIAKRKITIVGINKTTLEALDKEQTQINNNQYSNFYLEKDRFNTAPSFAAKMKLLGINIKNVFWYRNISSSGIAMQVFIKDKNADLFRARVMPEKVKVLWLTKASFTLPTYANSGHRQTKLKDLDLKLKTVSQENIKDLFIKLQVYGLPHLQSYQVYKITVNEVKNHDITYKVWVKNRNGQYDTRQFKIEFG